MISVELGGFKELSSSGKIGKTLVLLISEEQRVVFTVSLGYSYFKTLGSAKCNPVIGDEKHIL